MIVEERPISVGIRLSPSVKKRLDVEASRRGMYIYELVKEAIDRYIDEPKQQLGPHVSENLRPWLRDLAEVLASGDREAINLATTGIRYAKWKMQGGSADGTGQA